MTANLSTPESEDPFGSFLELAANDDLQGFKKHADRHPSHVDGVGTWYGRQKGSGQMALHHLTPCMVAAMYGSLDVLKVIISFPEVDVNQSCGADKSSALHFAASSGSANAVHIVKLLLAAGADPDLTDANGCRPIEVIFVSPNLRGTKCTLQMLLATDDSDSNSLPISPSHENGADGGGGATTPTAPEKKEYPADPFLPDIKISLYSTDEFRMFSFKVRPCSRAYSHDWTECPFAHQGENARRRDPRKYHYSCVPCPDFRKGACRRGDMCEYAHGVFECWLHPAQYRTRLCKDGTSCNRRVCFFAHMHDELRPLYISTGSAIPSPRADAMSLLSPRSPSPSFTPPMSPSTNGISPNTSWAPGQQNVPPLHLPGSNSNNLQSSRLRSSLHARDMDKNYFHTKSETPSNLDDIFFSEGSNSPRFSDFLPAHKSTIHNQFQQGMLLSPMKTSFSPRNIDYTQHQFPNADPISPMSAHLSMLTQHERFRSLSSRDLSSNASLDDNWSKWGPHNGPAEWSVTADELGRVKRSCSFENLNDGEEPDLSWVQSLVKESPQDLKEKYGTRLVGDVGDSTTTVEGVEDQSVLGAWIEQMQLDQLMAQ